MELILSISAVNRQDLESDSVSLEEELSRVLPTILAIRKALPAMPLSIDTYKAETARQALEATRARPRRPGDRFAKAEGYESPPVGRPPDQNVGAE